MDMLDRKRAPEALDVALAQSVADRIDGIERELAVAVLVDTAELVGVQASNCTHSKSGNCIRAGLFTIFGT